MRIIIFTLLMIITFPCFADWKLSHFQNGCTVYNFDREVKNFPGKMCIFLEDGSFVSAGQDSIKKFRADRTVVWELPGLFHHQLNLSHDKTRVLGLMSDITIRETRKEIDDIIVIINLDDGKVLYRRNARDILSSSKYFPIQSSGSPLVKSGKADLETSHFNSIYEIPENKGQGKAPFLKSGNIIINSHGIGIFILSHDLSKVLYEKSYSLSSNNGIHDVQVTSTGEFLIFNNFVQDPTTPYLYSAIQIFDPVSEKLTFDYPNGPDRALFFSVACGGVQILDNDHIFFSHLVNGGFIYSRKEKKIIYAIPGTNGDIQVNAPIQQLKLVDIRKFLENIK